MASGQEEVERSTGQGRNGQGGLFQGMSFWLSHNVPQRSRFKEEIQRHGGIVKLLEQDADVQLVDHKRKNLPVNVYSYQFIEKTVQNGRLENLETYRAGRSTPRPVGGTHIPAKGSRSSYTIEDDQILWDYMQPLESNPHASIHGNKIYQDFAEKYPRHTWQSWRDRYLKRVRGRLRPGGMIPQPTPRPTTDEAVRRSSPPRVSTSRPSTSRSAEVTAQRAEPSSRPQERKRKRSPDPPETRGHAGNRTTNTQLRRPTNPPGARRSSEVVVPPDPLVQIRRQEHISPNERASNDTTEAHQRSPDKRPCREVVVSPTPQAQSRESPRHERPPSLKKAKTSSKQPPEKSIEQTTEKRTPQEPTAETSAGSDNLLWELPFFPSSPVTEEAPEQDIDSWIEERLSRGRGTETQIIEALQCTSMDPALADKVLEFLVAGKGIPTDMRGVWTAEDDRCLEAQDSRDVQRVLDKHGDLLNSRFDYLQMARDALNPA
ncbi:putative transcription factor Rap1 [Aspergillus undulatus]|uniref:putative transcription factor Rap1 n=1 Tax=Aspergillus undulatus TaxID=1810928 RepID=UPI003CCD0609